MSSRTGQVANGKGKEGGEAMNEAGYQTLIVKFSEPITALDGIFDDAEASSLICEAVLCASVTIR